MVKYWFATLSILAFVSWVLADASSQGKPFDSVPYWLWFFGFLLAALVRSASDKLERISRQLDRLMPPEKAPDTEWKTPPEVALPPERAKPDILKWLTGDKS